MTFPPLQLCKKHHFGLERPERPAPSPEESKFLMKTFSQIKSTAPLKKKVKENKEKERLERRLLDELDKIFMDSDSFYFSPTYDLTNTVQRQGRAQQPGRPLWKQNLEQNLEQNPARTWCLDSPCCRSLLKVDDRFFWNKHMIQDIIALEVDLWVLPVIQGFVQVEELVVNYSETPEEERGSPETPPQEVTCVDDVHPRFTVALISRRSRHRAGMRYKRRGVDADGHVANYVETEQLVHVHSHTLAFVQTRGSVPVFWSQAGYRYNPRPRLEKGTHNHRTTQNHTEPHRTTRNHRTTQSRTEPHRTTEPQSRTEPHRTTEPHRAAQNHTEPHRTTLSRTEPHRTTQNHGTTEPHRTPQIPTEPHRTTQNHTEPHRTTLSHTDPHRSPQNHTEPRNHGTTEPHRSPQNHTEPH
ncbi:Phosphatidylinositide phosphatase SAC2 [Liparis tanakae]|uniref:Phosphatidylinositide phosphatase SAC2 n=1 Tax=Liparis tanakae TaxID=230148 RepID=A0A4Z2EA65_9TELE|nr:Phosphatidylinositide phosphatase SAC2 [Liparis tanakae]